MPVAPKIVRIQSRVSIFLHFRDLHTHRMLMKLTPGVDFTNLCVPNKNLLAQSVWQNNSCSVYILLYYTVSLNQPQTVGNFAKFVHNLPNAVRQKQASQSVHTTNLVENVLPTCRSQKRKKTFK